MTNTSLLHNKQQVTEACGHLGAIFTPPTAYHVNVILES